MANEQTVATPKVANYVRVNAIYRASGSRRHAGNPFIEALPPLPDSGDALLSSIEHRPPEPTSGDRKASEADRLADLNLVKDVVYPRPAYKKVAVTTVSALKEAYHARCPTEESDLRRRTLIAQADIENCPLPSDWKTSGSGLALIGASGTGKTTLLSRLLLPYQCVIEHTAYGGKPIRCLQVPLICVRIPHDGTLRSLCLQFFQQIDAALGTTKYERQALGVRTIARMGLLMEKVATAVSLAALVVDEFQNLRAARGPAAEIVLNLFTQLIERVGLLVVVAGTPAVESFMSRNVRNIRKLSSAAGLELKFMPARSKELESFQDWYWDYQYTKHKVRLDDSIRKAWYTAGAGNPAFMVMAFMFAQRSEIGGRERLDEVSFVRTLKNDMYLLQPAVQAILSGDPRKLALFDDLVFTETFDNLRSEVGWTGPMQTQPKERQEEFEDVDDAERHGGVPQRRHQSRRGETQAVKKGATEDPSIHF